MQNDLPALRYPDLTPQKAAISVGQISGEAFSHVGKYAGAVVLACFEQIGGLQRMADWADQNPTDFFTKLMPKLIQRSTQVDVSGTVTIDDAIARLESSPIQGEFTEVEDAEFFDL